MAVYDEGFALSVGAPRISNLMNYAGAALSLGLMIGVGVWGYQLIMRDVSGIPVVRAMEGDMRVLPDNPGGTVAMHTGLAVNEVAAMGEAGGLEDRLVLAPRTSGLAQEDLEASAVDGTTASLAPQGTDAPSRVARTLRCLSRCEARAHATRSREVGGLRRRCLRRALLHAQRQHGAR